MIHLISNNSLFINWNASGSCINHYNITIISNNTYIESITTKSTNVIINSLIIGTNYSFIIVPVDTGGREGPPSTIQYTWNGKNCNILTLFSNLSDSPIIIVYSIFSYVISGLK